MTKQTQRIGAACKWLESDGSQLPENNLKTTTVRYISGLSKVDQFAYMLGLVKHNMRALRAQIRCVGSLPKNLRMWRLGSDLLPLKTHHAVRDFYRDSDVETYIARWLRKCGQLARDLDVRLSFHPAQFVVLGSRNPGIRANSLRELEYHCDVFTAMGYEGWHDCGVAVNVHVGVKDPDIKAMRRILKTAQSNVQNFVTLENDEFSWSARPIVETFGDLVPVVLDIHHHWISEHRRIDPDGRLVHDIQATWKGIRPKLHVAMSAPELCDCGPDDVLNLDRLLTTTNKSKLRAHSQTAWHTRTIEYAGRFTEFDLMWEGKDKNLGAAEIAHHLQGT